MQEQEKRKLEEKANRGQCVAQKGVAVYRESSGELTLNFFTWGSFPRCWKVLLATVQKMPGDQGDYGLQRPVSCLDYESESGEREIIEEV